MLKAALPNRVPELPIQPVSRFQGSEILGPARSTGPPPDAMLAGACAFDWAWRRSGRRSCQGHRVTRPSTVQRLPNATFHSNEWRTNRPGGQRVHFSRTRILGVPGVSSLENYLDGRTTAVRVNILNPDTSEGIHHLRSGIAFFSAPIPPWCSKPDCIGRPWAESVRPGYARNVDPAAVSRRVRGPRSSPTARSRRGRARV